jgi:hypothetical protein
MGNQKHKHCYFPYQRINRIVLMCCPCGLVKTNLIKVIDHIPLIDKITDIFGV